MKFFSKYPRISSLLVGFGLGLVLVMANDHWATETVTEYKRMVAKKEAKYEELIAKSHAEIESLSKMNESLSQHIKTRKVTRPDGTIVEETDTDTNRSTEVSSELRASIEAETRSRVESEVESNTSESNKITKRKLRLGVGMTSDLRYYGRASYSVMGPIGIGFGMINDGTLLLDIGVSL